MALSKGNLLRTLPATAESHKRAGEESMDWKADSSGSSTVYTATLDAPGWKELASVLAEFWIKLGRATKELLKPGDFDRLYFEVWIDSGRIIGYPGKRGSSRGIRKIGVQVIIPMVKQAAEALPDPDEEQESFESEAMALEAKVWQAMRKASSDKTARTVIRELRQQNDFTIWRQSGDDVESAEEFFLA